ncbi:class I tRNA ligase family protein [Candidatus Parcubacteria bacterium]|nr:class I tRNA ligase family protein [Candidatus Parcubacteria bacterium]
MKAYDHRKLEKKWQAVWEKSGANKATEKKGTKKSYLLIEFPYPSGEGMHVGHIRSNTAMDVVARKRRAEGYEVLYPMGWDAFGLPAENYALKTGIHPAIITKKAINNFRRQLKSIGFSFDWSREVNTTDPAYYRWTQWIFLKLHEKGLAYKNKASINWCPKCKIGLANEEVIDGKCERCGTETEKREKEQWMLAITKYAERLDRDLDTVDFLEKIKLQQRNWIGRSEGAEIDFGIKGSAEKLTVFTTRPDTLFGATFVVLAPEHPLVAQFAEKASNKKEVLEYVVKAKKASEMERTAEGKEKTGVELVGVKAINPANQEELPVFVADFVLAQYGSGALMAVPAHDERDFAFAKKFELPVKRVVEPLFISSKGEDKIHPELPLVKREAICAVVRNPKNDTYLCVSWKGVAMNGLVTGGLEEGEDVVEAARREVLEETGYMNLRLVEEPSWVVQTQFYHRIKKQNRWARFHYVFFELKDEARASVEENEAALHEVVWKKEEELKSFFTVFEGEFISSVVSDRGFVHTGPGILGNSGEFSGMESEEAKDKIVKKVGGRKKTTFKLRDWVFSRQRYWGEPIPMINCEKCGWVRVPEKDLPVELPKVKNYQPTDNGESPLATIEKWVKVKCPTCKGPARRETDVMPNWAGSSWYFLRYADPKNSKAFASEKMLKHWTPVDWYNGGMEHTTLHLLYSRFWHKFLFDQGLVPTAEPYMKRTSHGLILAADGEKISKSKGNGISPDDVVERFGADSLRLYEMFMGPFDQAIAWNDDGLVGMYRFLERIWRLKEKVAKKGTLSSATETLLHQSIEKVGKDIEAMRFNTAVSQMMVLQNALEKEAAVPLSAYKTLLQLLAPFAPHITEELWQEMGGKKSIHKEIWPVADPKKLVQTESTIAVQVNGKVRATLLLSMGVEEAEALREAEQLPEMEKWLKGVVIKKRIFVPGKIINFVI